MTTGLLDPPPQPPQHHPLGARALPAKDLPAGSQLEIADFSMPYRANTNLPSLTQPSNFSLAANGTSPAARRAELFKQRGWEQVGSVPESRSESAHARRHEKPPKCFQLPASPCPSGGTGLLTPQQPVRWPGASPSPAASGHEASRSRDTMRMPIPSTS